ncbi:MAG: cupredoxin domain-containing protein [Pseudomonadota bacterium]
MRPTRRDVAMGAVASAVAPKLMASEAIHDVRITDFAFEPETLRVQVGDRIRWTNEDLAPHTATADEFGWDTEELARGESAEIVVSEGMETSYFCVFHPHMKGALEIV